MHESVRNYVSEITQPEEINGKHVAEFGSYDVNGSVRDIITKYTPASYTGYDFVPGPGVDVVSDVSVESFINNETKEKFDFIVSTEMMEHVEDWRQTINNIKCALKSSGILVLTTRSEGFPYHPYPIDRHRFSVENMKDIFKDYMILDIRPDPSMPGVFIKCKKRNVPRVNLNRIEVGRTKQEFNR